MPSVLIAGLPTRAAAESAVAAGFTVTTIDGFADIDLHPAVHRLSLPRDGGELFSAAAAARIAAGIPTDASIYLANFENHPDAVHELGAGRALWGNPPEVLRRVRNPVLLTEKLQACEINAPLVRMNAHDLNDSNTPHGSDDWLLKPLASGGGRGVRPWRGGAVPPGAYLQRRVAGTPGSAVFAAAGGASVTLGISRQLIGEAAFGAAGFRYCGNILTPAGDPAFDGGSGLLDAVIDLVAAVTTSFGLVGLNGIDFIADSGAAYPIEVNPRWSGSMELIERAHGISMFGVHAAACATATLPGSGVRAVRGHIRAVGKAIVFAREPLTMGDTESWLKDPTVRDVPRPGERIAAGAPICTVFAEADAAADCYDALVRRAQRVYECI